MRPAPRISPEVSPATVAIVRDAVQSLTNQAAGRAGEEIDKRLDFRMLSRQFGDLRLGFFQRLAAAVQQFIRVADCGNRFPAEAAAFQAFDIDAEWRRMVALAITNGGTSCATPEQPPTITCEPMTQNWCTAVMPPIMT